MVGLILKLLTAWSVFKLAKIALMIALAVAIEGLVSKALDALADAFVDAEATLVSVAGMDVPVIEMSGYMGITDGISTMIGALTAVFFVQIAYKILGIE